MLIVLLDQRRITVLRVGHGLAVVCPPRIHWISHDRFTQYEHAVPYAGRVTMAIAAGLQWWPVSR